ncbi:hypothetical protein IFM89_027246 [Coptis chinensis]|uniref:Uncharacterized protein n=1 Tax=Coptis chinensis TaxID=261450 RepID=A0A835H8Q9_9MAGN|nr:hypothetical protein IFM89_027246 [Coptis chinensis]
MNNTQQNLATLYAFGLPNKLRRAPRTLECYWTPPPPNTIKVNTDGTQESGPAGWESMAIVQGYFGT